jgi:hypothetical protein
MPPAISTLRQPHIGIIQAARKPPKAAPIGKPQNMALTRIERFLFGQYSLIKVTALGAAAPRPRPVMKRQITKWSRLPACDEIRQATPKTTTAPITTALRPSLSAMGPEPSAPAARPNKAALSTGARADLGMPHSSSSDGAM